MPSHRLTVTVPQPCHEDWQAMTPQAQGRFCQSCQKTVVDFTRMSDREVAEWLAKKQGRSCGRFRADQLGKKLAGAPSIGQQWTLRATFIALTAFLSTKAAEAKTMREKTYTGQKTQPITNSFSVSAAKIPSKTDSLVIRGIVLNSSDGNPIPGATISLKFTELQVGTDESGSFTLVLPDSLLFDDSRLVFSFIGMKSQELPVRQVLPQYDLKISLDTENWEVLYSTVLVGGVAVKYPWYTPRGLGQRIHNLFH